MIIGLIIVLVIVGISLLIAMESTSTSTSEICVGLLGFVMLVVAFVVFIWGCMHGFINYPPTEGTHQGVLTAVDLEGVHFRRYEVYLKSGEYTGQSDETKYLLYEYETELAEELKNAIGKMVKIHYGHDGGYIGWKSCGTYHIKSIEIIESEE